MKLTDVIRRPLITEKTSILREDGRTIVFEVAPGANKIEVKRAIETAARREGREHPHQHLARQGSSGRAGSPAAARTGRRPTSTLREGAKMPEFLEGRVIMPISQSLNPTSPGHAAFQTGARLFDEITTQEPHKPLVEPLHSTGGRNNAGHLTSWWRGGGHKRMYRIIDFKRNKLDIPAKVTTIEYDPNRSARIALLTYADGEKRYILQPVGMKVGDTIVSGQNVGHPAGQRAAAEEHPARHAAPQRGAEAGQGRADRAQRRIVGAAGGQGRRLRVGQDAVGRDSQDLHASAYATIGQVGNIDHENVSIGKAGRSRWKGISVRTCAASR